MVEKLRDGLYLPKSSKDTLFAAFSFLKLKEL
jgi:hypothetical protein